MCIRKALKLLILLGLFGYSAGGYCVEHIGNIVIEGNDKTDQRVILQEMIIEEGDLVDIKRIEESVQHVMDLNLFRSVYYRLERQATSELIDLIITVRERYYLFLLPSIKVDNDNQIEYGMRLTWDNLFGLNHRLKWKLIDTGSSYGVDERRNEVDYTMPRVFFSTYQLTLIAHKNIQVNDDLIAGLQEQKNQHLGFDVLKWLKKKGKSAGYFLAGGVVDRLRSSAAILPTGISKGVHEAFVYQIRGGYDDVHEYKYNRDGYSVQYQLDVANDEQGSAGPGFVKHTFDYKRYHSLDALTGRSLNVRLRIGSSNNDELGEPAFSLGGNTSMRGYKTEQFEGNSAVNANIEYLSTLYESSHLRKIYFLDIGDAFPRLTDMNISKLKYGAGVGLRWKAKDFVNINVRLDIGYGFETGEYRVAIGTRHTF